ncbi:hypothetical protein [Thiomicrorhabdus cannonii]|uniref:hypothetical protein n=1 Tax=Thiomicrorhabdus cannonii TaxID=2748011 RepID=UPI0015C04784|nr:hypothetical protein [Thiomicrorhabdus cannonii]
MELNPHNIAATLQVLRDPAGIPSHPAVFQVLMVLTWVFHILFVNIALGSATLSLYGFTRRQEPQWERLSIGMTKAAKVSVSMLIVLGVAPLLFTQVIYDPQWYASNILSASWAIGFIFTLILGYSSWFIFYFKNHQGAKPAIIVWGIVGLAMFVLDGFIMHALSYQALLPEQWMEWYAPDGQVDMSGSTIHAWQAGRFLFFMAMSITVIGVFLKAYAHYYKVREDYAADYRNFVNLLGSKIAIVGLVLQLVTFVWWLLSLPEHLHGFANPMSWIIMVFLAAFALLLIKQADQHHQTSYKPLFYAAIMALLVAIFRELIRIQYMLPYGYDILDYKVMEDLPSTALFFLTFVGVGGLVGGFFLTAIYKAGRTQGVYQASKPVAKLADSAVGVMIVWIAIFFLVGIWVWLKNAL